MLAEAHGGIGGVANATGDGAFSIIAVMFKWFICLS